MVSEKDSNVAKALENQDLNRRRLELGELRNAVLCGLAVVLAVALTNPVSESPFNDDWSYSFTVRKLLETGKLTYNGWASASLIAQAYWGWAWVKVFGFSYTVLRFSTVPLAAAAVSFCYLLGRRAGLNQRFAVFAALMLGLSPLYLPVASSFMTDAPGLFFIMLSMYAIARSIDAQTARSASIWLIVGGVVGLVGGTGRQFAWVVPLVMIPFAAWIRRTHFLLVLSASVTWMVVLAGALGTVYWFNHQPYAIPEIPLSAELKLAVQKPAHYLFNVLAIPLTTVWVILPAMWRVVGRSWTGSRALIVFALLIGPVLLLTKVRPKYGVAPWMGNTLSAQGIMGGAELAGDRPMVMAFPIRVAIAVIVFTVACILIADLILRMDRPFRAIRSAVRFLFYPDQSHALLAAMTWFAMAYFSLLLPRCAANMAYDRYILPLMPCVLFPLLLGYQKAGEIRVSKSGWILLGIYSLWSIAITQEVTALGRARAEAADKLLQQGVPRTLIDAGFEFDYETQLFATGYINDPRIKTPSHAFKKNYGPTFAVQSLYRLEFQTASDTEKTKYGYVDYTTYLYPFHRRIYIDQFSDAWWTDPVKAATRPADKWHGVVPPDLAGDEEK